MPSLSFMSKIMPCTYGWRREGYIGEGAFARSASPMLPSLGTFLFSDKKVPSIRNDIKTVLQFRYNYTDFPTPGN